MTLVALAPAPTVKLAGVAVSVKLGAAVIVSATVALLLIAAEVPVMVTVVVPVAAVELALNVTTDVCVALSAPNVAVTPDGRPVAVNVTAPLNPFCGVSVIVLVPVAPCATVTLAGVAAMVNPAAEVTVKLMAAVVRSVPDVPVTVTVYAP